jgi:hypothetical protein
MWPERFVKSTDKGIDVGLVPQVKRSKRFDQHILGHFKTRVRNLKAGLQVLPRITSLKQEAQNSRAAWTGRLEVKGYEGLCEILTGDGTQVSDWQYLANIRKNWTIRNRRRPPMFQRCLEQL